MRASARELLVPFGMMWLGCKPRPAPEVGALPLELSGLKDLLKEEFDKLDKLSNKFGELDEL